MLIIDSRCWKEAFYILRMPGSVSMIIILASSLSVLCECPSAHFNMSPGPTNSTTMWPPGTLPLADITASQGGEIILQPQPSDDPNDPLNWARWRKGLNMGLVCFYVAMVAELINANSPTWGPMEKELGYTNDILNDSYAAGCAALAVGSVILIPFALKFGRRPLYLLSTMVQFAVSIWSAKMQTVGDLMAINVIQCFFGSLAEVIVQMTIADLFFVHQRGRMNSLYVWTWLLSSYLGILVAGFVASGLGWRWIWWLNAIIFGVNIFVVGFGYEETKFCPPVSLPAAEEVHPLNIMMKKEDRNQDIKKDENLGKLEIKQTNADQGALGRASFELPEKTPTSTPVTINRNIPMKTYWQTLRRHLLARTTLSSSICISLSSFWQQFPPSLGRLLFTASWWHWEMSCPLLCPHTSLNTRTTSLPIRVIGVTIGALIVGPLSDWWIVFLSRRRHGIFEPEMRLWCMIPFLPFVIVGALLFAIGLNDHRSWPVIAVGLALYNVGVTPINTVTVTYLTDSYKEIVGDAIVGVTFIRNSFSTAFIFALAPWVAKVGLKNTFITILVMAIAILMIFVVFLRYGKAIRRIFASRYIHYAALQYKERGLD
ncbi:conserved hypothetical protein [Talaromyces stipitatus ATCC 10500]|uniref:Major facilitator superfamily (MFS) profile domain-containing protein n=1 Tax=Talaromyces stipitatus (strain ATCC 10500 / CBS 375.48 / QM 6759 / NRRL 1006) TaxID=441959 RepID=B8MR75_TALSN|nr:uncharacterized protein TSTA_054800 [Talaromyces stipitatus ATCC 10500]EED12970.1 conserved hypothetical protein [Talaromyces stipitatus ATCC 10500]